MKTNGPRVVSSAGAAAIKRAFDAEFGSNGVHSMVLPEDALGRESGGFEQNGWEVQYNFRSEDGVEYLEMFTTHRMTNDRLYRVYADGRVENVGASTDGMLKDSDRAFYDDVRRRGFNPVA